MGDSYDERYGSKHRPITLRNPRKKRPVSVASYFGRKSVKKYNSKTVAQHLAARGKEPKT